MNTDSFLLREVYPIVSNTVQLIASVFVLFLLMRLIFNYADPNPFGKLGRLSYQIKKRTDKFVYPAARLLAQFRINTKFAPLVTILITAILAYFLLQIIGSTFFIVDGLTAAIKANSAKALIGWTLYAIISIYVLLIFIRFIGAWFVFTRKTFLALVYRLTNPILIPVQKLIPPIGMFDLSAMIVLLLLGFLQTMILRTFVYQ